MNACNQCGVEIPRQRKLCDGCRTTRLRESKNNWARGCTPAERLAIKIKNAKRAVEWLKSIGEI